MLCRNSAAVAGTGERAEAVREVEVVGGSVGGRSGLWLSGFRTSKEVGVER